MIANHAIECLLELSAREATGRSALVVPRDAARELVKEGLAANCHVKRVSTFRVTDAGRLALRDALLEPRA